MYKRNIPPMSPEEYMKRFEKMAQQMIETTKKKNHDYSGEGSAFHNFSIIEELTKGIITVEDGIMVRITDKMTRLANAIRNPLQVKSESKKDTSIDGAVYFMILAIWMEWVEEHTTLEDKAKIKFDKK